MRIYLHIPRLAFFVFIWNTRLLHVCLTVWGRSLFYRREAA